MVEFFVLSGLVLLALALLWTEGLLEKQAMRVWAAGGVLLAAFLCWFTLPYDAAEDARLLTEWAAYFRYNGGFAALAAHSCPYPLAVQYLLALFSWVEYPALYLMKYMVFFGDILLGWGCCRLAAEFTRKMPLRLAAFLLAMLLPSGVVLGGYAAMGESLWCALAILAAAQALADRPWGAMALWGLAFCFGMGAVFLLPVFLVLLLRKRLRMYHFLMLPVVLAAATLPALWPERPLRDVLLLLPLLSDPGNRVLFQGSPGLYALKGSPLPAYAGWIIFAVLCLLLIWWLASCGKRLKDETMVAALAFTAVAAAMLLPRMGEDSLYAAEALCIVLAVSCRWIIPAAVLCSATSLLSCLAAQFGKVLMPLHWGAVVLLGVLVMLTVYMYTYAYKGRSRRR